MLALFGALYGSLKALGQVRVPQLLAYAEPCLLFSSVVAFRRQRNVCRCRQSSTGAAVVLITAGLLLAWRGVQERYGDLTLDRMHGLARAMPRFATVLSLLVMAAIGLPPFGLFSGYMAMLLQSSIVISWGLMVILFTWFLASWYLFRMMQRLLFGSHRPDIPL